MRTARFVFIVYLGFTFCGGSAFAMSNCEAALTMQESGLLKSIRMNEELQVTKYDFEYEVLTKNIDGVSRTLILVADFQVKRSAGSGAKADLIRTFPYVVGTPAFTELSPSRMRRVRRAYQLTGELVYDRSRARTGLIQLSLPRGISGEHFRRRDETARIVARTMIALFPVSALGMLAHWHAVSALAGGAFVATYLAWRFILNPQYGVLNQERRQRFDEAVSAAIEDEFKDQLHVTKILAFVDLDRFPALVGWLQREGWRTYTP